MWTKCCIWQVILQLMRMLTDCLSQAWECIPLPRTLFWKGCFLSWHPNPSDEYCHTAKVNRPMNRPSLHLLFSKAQMIKLKLYLYITNSHQKWFHGIYFCWRLCAVYETEQHVWKTDSMKIPTEIHSSGFHPVSPLQGRVSSGSPHFWLSQVIGGSICGYGWMAHSDFKPYCWRLEFRGRVTSGKDQRMEMLAYNKYMWGSRIQVDGRRSMQYVYIILDLFSW